MSSQHLAVPIDVYKYSYNIMYTSTKAKLYACKKNRSLQGKGRYVHVCRRDTRKLLVMKPELLGKIQFPSIKPYVMKRRAVGY